MFRRSIPVGLALCALTLGCHQEVEMIPLIERTIYVTDRFYDVQALSKSGAIVVGYGGKIVQTTDGGNTWEVRPSGTEPKAKFYFDIREPIAEGESIAAATARAEATSKRLADAFVAFATG